LAFLNPSQVNSYRTVIALGPALLQGSLKCLVLSFLWARFTGLTLLKHCSHMRQLARRLSKSKQKPGNLGNL